MLAKINSDNKYIINITILIFLSIQRNLATEEFRKRKQMDTENKRLAINNN